MDTKLAFILGLLFLAVTVKSDVRHSNYPKTCQEATRASGGSLDDMVSQLFPCNAEETHRQETTNDEDSAVTESSDERYDLKRSQDIALSVLDLSQRLTENIISQGKTKKYEIISPISIASALQLTLLGAHGMTFNELMDLLEYNSKSFSQYPYQIHEEFGLLLEDLISNTPNSARFRPKVPWRENASSEYERKAMRFQSNQPNYDEHKISVANGIFVQQDFLIRDEYKEVVENVYKSQIKSLDFRGEPQKSAKFINDWVNEKTNGKIKEIIPGSTSSETRVILANALYFKAEWQETFIEGATGFKNFYPNGRDSNDTVMVELMAHGGKFPHFYDAESDCEILGLPYKQNGTTMYVILPKDSNAEKLRAAQKILTAEKIEYMISQMVIKTAVILFPKMHLTSGHCLKSSLQDLGLRTLFEPQQSDLSVISEGTQRVTRTPSRIQQTSFDPTKQLLFGRMSDDTSKKSKRDVTYKTGSESLRNENPLTIKDFMLRKRIVKKSEGKKLRRSKRQYRPFSAERLDAIRHMKGLKNPQLFAEEVIHKVDLTVNEKGTEGGAATAITLNRSGTNVVFRVDIPFMFLIRHDPTHVPLFYGVVFEPEN